MNISISFTLTQIGLFLVKASLVTTLVGVVWFPGLVGNPFVVFIGGMGALLMVASFYTQACWHVTEYPSYPLAPVAVLACATQIITGFAGLPGSVGPAGPVSGLVLWGLFTCAGIRWVIIKRHPELSRIFLKDARMDTVLCFAAALLYVSYRIHTHFG